MATTKSIEVTKEQRAAGIMAITVNEPTEAEKAAAAAASLLEKVEAEKERLRLYHLATAALEAEGFDPAAELARLGL